MPGARWPVTRTVPEMQGSKMSPQAKRPSVLASVLEWCRNRRGAGYALSRSAPSIPDVDEHAPPAAVACEPAGYFFDGGMLFRCMDMLQIDRDALAKDDPLLFRELQGRCTLCRSKEECAPELAHEFADTGWDKWRAYCPNSAMLTTIGAVQNCALAAQHLKMPRSAASSACKGVTKVPRRGH